MGLGGNCGVSGFAAESVGLGIGSYVSYMIVSKLAMVQDVGIISI